MKRLRIGFKASFVRRGRYSYGAICGLVLLSSLASAVAQQAPFALRPDDRVVFYGDSITEQKFYTLWTELYVTTRFPSLRVRFFNAGVGGDRVTSGGGGDIDTRLDRDVFSRQPTVITIMLGMNDGQYVALTPAIEDTYRRGYQHILDSIHQHAPEARVLIIGPSPYDEITRSTPLFPGGYNATLVRFGEIGRQLATANHASFTDANAPFVAMLKKAVAQDNFAAQMLVPDRVHPDLPSHLMIAAAVLRAWNAPAILSKICIDSKSLTAPSVERAEVSGLAEDSGVISWMSTEQSLPMPLWNHAGIAFVDSASGVVSQLNEEILQVVNLAPGNYHLRVDDSDIRDFTADELQLGFNLASLLTPMLHQAQSAEWTMRDKEDLQVTRLRILIAGSSPNADAALTLAENTMQEKVWQMSIPKPHHFILSPVGQ